MRQFLRVFLSLSVILFFANTTYSQTDRINYNDQDLFLSGANLAWVYFASDIGPGYTDYNNFADVMLQMHDNGGNALRWWLHTNGSTSPEFDSNGNVIGPAEQTIEDLKTVLDLAWEREIGVVLCLWSFDMLRQTNSSEVLARNEQLLTDTNYTRTYINNALIPMVDSLKGHPAIIAWEIFNEPEGMSNEFGWSGISHVSMANIQRFINLTTGAIHRIDPEALVTSGSWCFHALTDVQTTAKINPAGQLSQLSNSEKERIAGFYNTKYRLNLSTDKIIDNLTTALADDNYNYYTDDRLIAEGGDEDGILDFYSVHYYTGLGSQYSPFSYEASHWGLDKPIVVAEFAMEQNHGTATENLFPRLFNTGYAGALPWAWSDTDFSSIEDMLAGMLYMYENYNEYVDIDGIGGDWPTVSITSPADGAEFPDSIDIVLEADAADTDGEVVSVEFIANDTLSVGIDSTAPYSVDWMDVQQDSYRITAVATDNEGHQRYSDAIEITVGISPFTNFEAESATWTGSSISIINDVTASNDKYVEIRTSEGSLTWVLPDVLEAGNFEIVFGYRLTFGTPKNQFIYVNGDSVADMEFTGDQTSWLEKSLAVDLVTGENVITMQFSWGWMDIDYLAVPSGIVTAVEDETDKPIPAAYSLKQNYPNPFNPSTTIEYTITKPGKVMLKVYDVLGREIAELVNKEQMSGSHKVEFDASHLASGVYIYRLQAGDYVEAKRMLLLK